MPESQRSVTFGPAPGVPVEVECECGWFARGRGFDLTDAGCVGRQLLKQHRDKDRPRRTDERAVAAYMRKRK